jgi:hypothetical protein
MDGIQDAFSKGLDVAQPFLFGLGFVFGATEANAKSNASMNYSSNLAWRIKDTLSNLGIGGVTVAPGYTSVSSFKFRPTGFVNKGLAAAVAVWIYKEAKLPYHKEIYKAVFPFAVGYSLGGLIDPPTTAIGVGGSSGLVGATYSGSASYLTPQGGIVIGNVPFARAEGGRTTAVSVVV